MANVENLREIATQVRRDIIRMVSSAASGHPGGSLSSADFLTALFFGEMNHDPQRWTRDGKGYDMFFLSAGHLTPVYYSLLARSGYFPVSELASFRKMGSKLQGHPSVEKGLRGIHIASGSLGQGLSVATGAAMAKRIESDESFVFVLVGDGECEEGQIWEAAAFATHHKAARLIAITDWNGQQIDGTIESVSGGGDIEAKWRAFGWDCIVADGHSMESVIQAYRLAKDGVGNGNPKMILMKTVMGRGVDFMEGTNQWHGKAPSEEQAVKALSQLGTTSLLDF